MDIFIVVSGEYSGYGIRGVFSSKAKAEEYIANVPADDLGDQGDRYRIEEYVADSERPLVYGPVWHAALDLEGVATTKSYEGVNITEQHYAGERGSGYTPAGFYDDRRLTSKATDWFFGQSYVSAEHALKIAVEQRQKALREHPDFFPAEALK